MLLSEAGRGAVIFTVTVILMAGKLSIPLLLVAVFVEETLEVFATLADQRCVRSLVAPAQASSAQARIEARTHAVVLAGRPLGAFLFSLAHTLPFLTDALSFVVSVLSITGLKSENLIDTGTQRIARRKLGNDIAEGLNWLVHDSYARAAMILSAGTTLIGQALIMVFLAEANKSRLPTITVGLVLAASGVGGVLGSLISARLRTQPKSSLLLIQMAAWVGAFAILVILGAGSIVCMAFVMATLSLAGALGNIEFGTHLMKNVDEKMMARATSIGRLVALSAFALGPMLGGILIQLHGAQYAIVMLFLLTLAFAMFAACTRSIRHRTQSPVDELIAHGATVVSQHHLPGGSHHWALMQDSEGYEFCAARSSAGWD